MLEHYLNIWNLIPNGGLITTHSSLIQPVLYRDTEAILKIPFSPDEKKGSKLMIWWDGMGAAKVYEHEDNAILMERITGDRSLKAMAGNNRDDEATCIICGVADQLHALRNRELPELTPLDIWFNDLFTSAERYGGIFVECAELAAILLEQQPDITVLHGDLHHENILYSSERGWLAIDPKGLVGNRAFDYANILCNPDKEIALTEGRLSGQINVISENTGISRMHLLEWTAAWAGLSAVWFLNDDMDGSLPMEIAERALREVKR